MIIIIILIIMHNIHKCIKNVTNAEMNTKRNHTLRRVLGYFWLPKSDKQGSIHFLKNFNDFFFVHYSLAKPLCRTDVRGPIKMVKWDPLGYSPGPGGPVCVCIYLENVQSFFFLFFDILVTFCMQVLTYVLIVILYIRCSIK